MKNEEQSNSQILLVKIRNSYPNKKFQSFVNRYFHYNKQNLGLKVESRRRIFQITIMLFRLIELPQKLKMGRTYVVLITLFNLTLISMQLKSICCPH